MGREGGWMGGVQPFMEKMAAHDCIGQATGNQFLIGLKLIFVPGFRNIGESPMGVAPGAAMAGKMFEAAEDAPTAVCLDPETGMGADGSGRWRKAALKSADHRIFRKGVEVNNRGKIQINPHGLQGVG